jgi:methylenetetrahydrofolate reductase (NADPH)
MTKRFSFEFFPPKTPVGLDKLRLVREQLNALNPDFYSVTYGAGGSTRDNTIGVIKAMRAEGIDVAPHISFGGDSEEEMVELLDIYRELDVKRLVALRGDIPSGMGMARMVYANELVEFIRKHSADHFEIEVAAYPEIHPEAKSFQSDVQFLKQKFDCGANSAITQYFFNADSYFYFMEECARIGITNPVYAGIMPITNFTNLCRFSANCGAEIPRWLKQKIEGMGDDAAGIAEFGVEFISRLSEQLLAGGAPGIHFYTMNQVEPTQAIWTNLGINR